MVKSKNIPIFYAFLSILIFLHDDLPKFLVSASRSYKRLMFLSKNDMLVNDVMCSKMKGFGNLIKL